MALFCLGLSGMILVSRRAPLSTYEEAYAEALKDVFADQPANRRKLLIAIRKYDTNNLNGALRILFKLKDQCKNGTDFRAVSLFAALYYDDGGAPNQAIAVVLNLRLARRL